MKSIFDALLNNFVTKFLAGCLILYGIYFYVVKFNINDFYVYLSSIFEYIVLFIVLFIYITINKQYIKDFQKEYFLISLVFFVTAMLAYIETNNYITNVLLMTMTIVGGFTTLKFIVSKFQNKLAINKNTIYLFYSFYIIASSMVNDNIVLFSLINAFTYYLAMAYTTKIPCNLKVNIQKLKEEKTNGGIGKYFYAKKNKISKSVVILMVLFYSLLVFFLFFVNINLFKLVLLSVVLTTSISYLYKHNKIEALKHGVYDFNYFKNKFFNVKSKIINLKKDK